MSPLVFAIMLAVHAETNPVPSAIQNLDNCLIRAARNLKLTRSDEVVRYKAFARACSRERQRAIDLVLERSSAFDSKQSAESRWKSLETAMARVDERYRIWAARELETRTIQRDLGMDVPITNID